MPAVISKLNHTSVYQPHQSHPHLSWICILVSSISYRKIKVLCLANYMQSINTVQLLLPYLFPSFNGKLCSSSFRRKFNLHVILETLVYSLTPIWDAAWGKREVKWLWSSMFKNARLNQIFNRFFMQDVSGL